MIRGILRRRVLPAARPVTELTASTAPKSGVTYLQGIADLDAETVSLFCSAISNNGDITGNSSTVYIDVGSIHRRIDIGDQVTLALNGTEYSFDVIGFNHDELTDPAAYGQPTATGRAGMTLQMHDLLDTTHSMRDSNINTGGWRRSDMRSSTMETMRGDLPSAWQSVLKPVQKASGTGGSTSSGTETVSDHCFLLAEVEIFGSTTHSVSGEGSQYAYYRAGGARVKNKTGSAYVWWERSPCSGTRNSFCRVGKTGTAASGYASVEVGVAFAFCV